RQSVIALSCISSRRQPRSTVFPYTTLFRSTGRAKRRAAVDGRGAAHQAPLGDHDRGVPDRNSVPVDLGERSGQRSREIVASEVRSEEHTSELQSREKLVYRLLLEKKKTSKH